MKKKTKKKQAADALLDFYITSHLVYGASCAVTYKYEPFSTEGSLMSSWKKNTVLK